MAPRKRVNLISSRPSLFRVESKQNSLFPIGPVMKCFVTLMNSKKKNRRKIWLTMVATIICRFFKENDLIYVLEESSICCLPRELASSVHSRELVSFDP